MSSLAETTELVARLRVGEAGAEHPSSASLILAHDALQGFGELSFGEAKDKVALAFDRRIAELEREREVLDANYQTAQANWDLTLDRAEAAEASAARLRKAVGEALNRLSEMFAPGKVLWLGSPTEAQRVADKINAARKLLTAALQPETGTASPERVTWKGTDSTFEGVIVARYRKINGKPMVVVEDDRGLQHIYPDDPARLVPQLAQAGDCEACNGTGTFQGGRASITQLPCKVCGGTGKAQPTRGGDSP